MNELRVFIQTALNNVSGVECGAPMPDSMIEQGVTYFGYQLNNDFIDTDYDRNDSRQASIVGHIVRKMNSVEDGLYITDTALKNVVDALKSLNFHCSYQDVSLDRTIRKIQITGYARYNEINNWLV